MKPQIYTANELAKILKCNPHTIYRMGKRGEIERIKLGKLVRFYLPTAKGQGNELQKTK